MFKFVSYAQRVYAGFSSSFLLIFSLLFSLLLALPSLAESPAEQTMQKVHDRPRGKDFQAQVEMMVQKGTREQLRKILWWSQNTPKGQRDLIKFLTPISLKSAGLLVKSFDEQEDLVWLYLSQSAKKEPRRIAGSQKSGRFLGSEFSYVDFEERQFQDFTYRDLGKEGWRGFQTHKIESTPKDSDYAYSKLVLWVDRKSSVPVKIDLYQDKEKIKTFEVLDLKKQDGIWTVMNSKMTNHKSKKFSRLKIQNIQYNNGLSEEDFTLNKLKVDL